MRKTVIISSYAEAKMDSDRRMIARARKPAAKAPPKSAINPLKAKWNSEFGLPPFDKIEARHFKPALEAAFRQHKEEIEKIASNPAKPTFANTILALEKSGWQLSSIASVFWNIEGSDSTPELQEVARDMAPRFAAHETRILLDKRLFKRIADLYERRESLKLSDEDRRVLERHHLEFVRAGARLSPAEKSRVKEINARLATLVTQFMQNVLKDEQSWRLVLEDETDLAGLPSTLQESAEHAAADAKVDGKGMITLARSSVEGFLTFSSRRDLREQAFEAWVKRGAHDGDTDNRQIVAEAVALRSEYARLMGFKSFAEFSLQAVQGRHFLAARAAPRRPEVQQDRFALEARERQFLACGILEFDVGQRLRRLFGDEGGHFPELE